MRKLSSRFGTDEYYVLMYILSCIALVYFAVLLNQFFTDLHVTVASFTVNETAIRQVRQLCTVTVTNA